MHPDVAKLVDAGRISQIVGERLSQLAPGNYCLHKNWGAGKIIDWDLAGGKVTIDFETNSSQVMALKFAIQKTEVLAADHFRAQKLESLEELRGLAANDPVELLRRTLESQGGSMKMDQIDRELMGSVVPEADYKKWWDKAKKALRESRIAVVPTKRTDPIVLRQADMSGCDSLFMDYTTARDLKSKAKALEAIIKDSKQLEGQDERLQELLADIDDTARKGLKLHLGHSLDMMASRDELVEKFDALELSNTALRLPEIIAKESARLGGALGALAAARQRAIYEQFPIAFGDTWVDEILSIFDVVGARGLAEIAKFLLEEEKGEALYAHLRKLLLGRTLGADSLLWVCRERKKSSQPVFDIEVGTAILSLLERDSMDDGPRKSSRLQSYFMEDKTLIGDLLEGAEGQLVRNFGRKLITGQVFQELDRKSLMARVIKARPETQDLVTGDAAEDEDSGWVSSWESIERMKEDLRIITSKKIPQNREDIKIAKSYGDLKENAEYHMAKDQQKVLMAQKAELESNLDKTQGTDFANAHTDVVSIGTVVTLEGNGETEDITILGAWDSDPDNNVVGYLTQLGKDLIGSAVGDKVVCKGKDMVVKSIAAYNAG